MPPAIAWGVASSKTSFRGPRTSGMAPTGVPIAGVPHAMFPAGQTDAGGALIQDGRRKPSSEGTLIYLDAAGKLDVCVERIRGAGGTLLMPKTDIGDPGFIAVFRDSEGNSVALHSPRIP